MGKIQTIRGFNDIIDHAELWQILERQLANIGKNYGYSEIRTPMLEASGLFERSIGVTSDIVHKEMYTFADKNEQTISLRPEGTASVVRACIEHSLLYDRPRKFFYQGPMFRRERPQRGRLRQFHQFGMECLGFNEPYADIEQLTIIQRIWETLGLQNNLTLEINYLGSQKTRQRYGQALKEFYQKHHPSLSDLDKKRWEDNTLRLLDSKEPTLVEINRTAPTIDAFYTDEEQSIFATMQMLCRARGINATVNPHLMRGLDYYTGLIYEWKSDDLGSQSTVCGGGRYDLLFESLGAKAVGACGFSIGMERLLEILKTKELQQRTLHIHLLAPHQDDMADTLQLAEEIRNALPDVFFYTQFEHAKLGNLIKKASKQGAHGVVICGENERLNGQYTFKNLQTGHQVVQPFAQLIQQIKDII